MIVVYSAEAKIEDAVLCGLETREREGSVASEMAYRADRRRDSCDSDTHTNMTRE